jgi:hypothetical protein
MLKNEILDNFLEERKGKEDIIDGGKKVSFGWYANQYGIDLANNMLEKQRRKRKEAAEKKNSFNVVKNFKPKENKHKQKPIDGQFLALTDKQFFNNEGLMKKLANKTGLLLVLLRNKVDWDKNERLNLYQEYFLKRKLLVASISRPRLAEMFGRDVRRITAWAKALEKDGILKIERISCMDDDYNWKKYNVYILGEVNDDGSYTFYYER